MKPMQPNYKSDLEQIKVAISDLVSVVTSIKKELGLVSNKINNPNQLDLNLPNVNTTWDYYPHEEERWRREIELLKQ